MAKRRAHGEGSVFQRADGRWSGAVTVGFAADGRQKRKTVYGRTQAEALAKLEEVKRKIHSGAFSDTRLKLADYLDQRLEHKKRSLKPSTYAKYEYCVEHVKEHIGGSITTKLKPLHVQAALSKIADVSGVPTANNCRLVSSNALKQAVRWQIAIRNPVEAVDPCRKAPRHDPVDAGRRRPSSTCARATGRMPCSTSRWRPACAAAS